jgi:hypothetical protein
LVLNPRRLAPRLASAAARLTSRVFRRLHDHLQPGGVVTLLDEDQLAAGGRGRFCRGPVTPG